MFDYVNHNRFVTFQFFIMVILETFKKRKRVQGTE